MWSQWRYLVGADETEKGQFKTIPFFIIRSYIEKRSESAILKDTPLSRMGKICRVPNYATGFYIPIECMWIFNMCAHLASDCSKVDDIDNLDQDLKSSTINFFVSNAHPTCILEYVELQTTRLLKTQLVKVCARKKKYTLLYSIVIAKRQSAILNFNIQLKNSDKVLMREKKIGFSTHYSQLLFRHNYYDVPLWHNTFITLYERYSNVEWNKN